ncbi:MAG: hypothetical protein KC438_06505 [Thermomicrobiales bacterium]|nr:hypothetical protein [Thermomicrobiales bacterium]MCO5221685.1 hypothetical protein [Thermomicrobiales bacterium]
MVTIASDTRSFAGSKAEQETASELFRVLQSVGRFMAIDAPIRLSLDSAAEFFAEKKISQDAVVAAIKANPEIFQLDESGDSPVIVGSRAGTTRFEREVDRTHSFATRLMTPAPKSEHADSSLRPRPRMDSNWSIFDVQTTDLDMPSTTTLAASLSVAQPVEEAEADVTPAEIEEIVAEASRTITVPAAAPLPTDVSEATDAELEAALIERLGSDGQVAMFDGQWMLEDRVPRFSKGELRKLKDYIVEQEQPLTDEVLIQDVLDVRPRSADFGLMRFALNYRLSKEHRDFEFVGTSGQRFWSTSALAPIGTTLRKPNEIGTDYKFLLEEAGAPTPRTRKELSHVLTFYEFSLGLLPYDGEMQEMMAPPVTVGQRTAVLTFECPQVYTTYLVELRYPTPNRGGFIVGLDDFYTENLVPGALLSIRATENDGHYVVEYVNADSQSQRLLELEERRQRYVFRPTSFACGVIDEALLTEELWSSLNGEKPLDEKTRRRPETVVAMTFERIGKTFEGGGFTASFAQLLAGVNIERPFSETLLRSILEHDDTGAFAKDPDGPDDYTYIPGNPA